jgi:hypothetical protein
MKTIKADKEKNFEQNYVTSNIIDCVAFWNREGEIAIENNLMQPQNLVNLNVVEHVAMCGFI